MLFPGKSYRNQSKRVALSKSVLWCTQNEIWQFAMYMMYVMQATFNLKPKLCVFTDAGKRRERFYHALFLLIDSVGNETGNKTRMTSHQDQHY